MSDAFTDVAKMKKIKEEIKAHEGQIVEMTLENGLKSILLCLLLNTLMKTVYLVNQQQPMLNRILTQIF